MPCTTGVAVRSPRRDVVSTTPPSRGRRAAVSVAATHVSDYRATLPTSILGRHGPLKQPPCDAFKPALRL